MKEAIFQQEIGVSVKFLFPDVFYLKLKDDAAFGGSKTRFSPKKPFDCFWILPKTPHIAMELKMEKTADPLFDLDRVAKHQIDGLQRWEKSGGKSFIVINHRVKGVVNDVYAITLEQLLYLRIQIGSLVAWSVLKNYAIMLERISLRTTQNEPIRVWDLRPLLKFVQQNKDENGSQP